ncbi:hypothetical protein TKK_0014799 [Trichogramma kaykai]
METKMFRLNGTYVRKLVYQFVEKIGIHQRFDKKKEMTGKDWIKSFLKRHNLFHRKVEHTSSARFKGFSKSAVKQFFTLLEGLKEFLMWTRLISQWFQNLLQKLLQKEGESKLEG